MVMAMDERGYGWAWGVRRTLQFKFTDITNWYFFLVRTKFECGEWWGCHADSKLPHCRRIPSEEDGRPISFLPP
jgi:hypothetical protein